MYSGGQQHADQPHVVIERQPAHTDVVGRQGKSRRDRLMAVTLASRLRVRQHDALWAPPSSPT